MARTIVTCGDCHEAYEAHARHDCDMRFRIWSRRVHVTYESPKVTSGTSGSDLADLIATTIKNLPDLAFETTAPQFDKAFNMSCKEKRPQAP